MQQNIVGDWRTQAQSPDIPTLLTDEDRKLEELIQQLYALWEITDVDLHYHRLMLILDEAKNCGLYLELMTNYGL
jgi:hypothetical protein